MGDGRQNSEHAKTQFELFISGYKKMVRESFISIRVLKHWNRLPQEIVEVTGLFIPRNVLHPGRFAHTLDDLPSAWFALAVVRSLILAYYITQPDIVPIHRLDLEL